MRIVFVGPGFRFKHRFFYYSFYKMLLSGFYRTDNLISFLSDRDTADSFMMGWRAAGVPLARRYLLETCRELKPDLLVWCHADIIDLQTLETIKQEHGTKICLVDCDYLDVSAPKSAVRRLNRVKSVIDAAFFTTAGRRLAEAGEVFENSFFVPNPLDPGAFTFFEQRDRPLDVGYVSNGRGRSNATLRYLKEQELNVEVRGGKKEKSLYGAAFEAFLCSAKAGLIDSLYNEDMYSSDRLAQVFGAGCLAMIPRSIGLQKYIGGDEALFFDEPAELADRLRQLFASDQWYDMAQRGREAYLSQFNSKRVADYIIEKTLNPEKALGSFDEN